MRAQPVSEENWTEAEAVRLVHGLSAGRRPQQHTGMIGYRQDALARTVQDEVIPRLLAAHRPRQGTAARLVPPGPEQVSRLVDLALEGGQADPLAYVESLRQGGTPVEALLLELLAPAARRLGRMWEDDTCTFSDLTLAMLRLVHVLRRLGRESGGEVAPRPAAPRALLVQMPGEQHGFGLAMLAQFFRRAGWRVRQEPVATSAELAGLVRAHWFALVGISVSCDGRLAALEADIRAIRRQSRNHGVRIMVGGPPFAAHPQLAAMVGADATAADASGAVREANRLVSLQAAGR